MNSPGRERRSWISSSLCATTQRKSSVPIWPGQPMTAHWGIADPAAVKGTPEEIARAFRDAFVVLDRRIGLFTSLPLSDADRRSPSSRRSKK